MTFADHVADTRFGDGSIWQWLGIASVRLKAGDVKEADEVLTTCRKSRANPG
jgi:hypothetical protein